MRFWRNSSLNVAIGWIEATHGSFAYLLPRG